MFYYMCNEKLLISKEEYSNMSVISEIQAEKYTGMIFALSSLSPKYSRRSFSVSNENFLFLKEENLNLLVNPKVSIACVPQWIKLAIKNNRVTSLNTQYPNWQEVLTYNQPTKWRIH
ncbi:MAG: hypothetical protein ACI8WT_003587, partial [Clostridium sp.]